MQIFRCQILDPPGLTGGAVEQRVVHDGQIAVLEQVDVQLDAIAGIQRRLKSGHAVFRNAVSMEPPVGVRPALQVFHARVAVAAADGQQV